MTERLSPHFTADEFRCRCQRPECPATLTPIPALVDILEALRARVGPLTITSGLRCDYWNRFVGGQPGSEHLTGHAADVRCDTSQARYALVQAAITHGVTRLGVDRAFVHVGVSPSHPQQVVWVYPAG